MNNDILKLVRQKRKLWKEAKLSCYNDKMGAYKTMEKKCVSCAKHSFERNLARKAKSKLKAFHAYLNSKKANRIGITHIQDQDGILHSDNLRQAKILNNYFSSVFVNEDVDGIRAMYNGVGPPQMDDFNIAQNEVQDILQNLKVVSAPGPDGFHPRILVEASEKISLPLALIYNKSHVTGEVPEDWRCANVMPVFKKGRKSDPSNYRPISLTSIICKVLERILKVKILEHLERNDLIRKSQHGFMHTGIL
jgi:hypothetical protein